jgi:hypothetical protein
MTSRAPRIARDWWGSASLAWRASAAAGGLALACLSPGLADAEANEVSPAVAFFDPVISIGPGISREVDLLFDHVGADAGELTVLSLRLQYPVSPWLQFSLELPVTLRDPDAGSLSTGVGDLLLQGQARVWAPREWPAELDAGLELAVPTGGDSLIAGSTAVRPFLVGGVKLGRIDVIGNLSYQWLVAGPFAGGEVLQASLSVGYVTRWIAPFTEFTLTKPVKGFDDLRSQVAVVPGLEVFLPWNVSLSVGVQLPLSPRDLFRQRVLAFLKWPF